MNEVLQNQIAGLLRAFGPVAVGLLIKWGLPEAVATPFVEWAVMIVAGAVAAGWSWYSNREDNVAKQAASTPGVTVQVGHDAPDVVKKVANDPTAPSVVLKMDH